MSAYRAKHLEEIYKVLEDINVSLQRQPVLRHEFSARVDEACYLVADM
jgi:hypothetical protein